MGRPHRSRRESHPAWLTLFARYKQHATHPFGVDAATLRRDDGDHGRKASIRFFRDQTGFWNPGDAFATTDELLDPTEKEVRTPAIVAAFRWIGLSGQAGTGVRAIFRGWQRLGYVPPLINTTRRGRPSSCSCCASNCSAKSSNCSRRNSA